MCRAADAADARGSAAQALLGACREAGPVFGIGPGLRQAFVPSPLGTEWDGLLARINQATGGKS